MGSEERRERERGLRKLHILGAARKVLAKKGIQGVTMEEIAHAADYKPATLYLYFKNKDELITSLTVAVLEHAADRFEALAAQGGLSWACKAAALPEVLLEVYRYDPPVLMSLFRLQASAAIPDLSPEMAKALNAQAARCLKGLAALVEQGIEGGAFKPVNPMAMADSLWGVFSGLVLWEESKRLLNPAKDYLGPTLQFALGLMFASLLADPAGYSVAGGGREQ